VRGEILQLKGSHQHDGRPAALLRVGSDARRARRSAPTASSAASHRAGVAGTWKDLTDSVNAMCGKPHDQVRNIAQVTTAVARGDLSRKITVDVRGEILELKDTINTMVDQLNGFASGSHARRPRGRHRGQARRPGAMPASPAPGRT